MMARARPSSTAKATVKAPESELFPPRDRRVVPARRARIQLPRAANLLVGILDHFLPLRDPADGSRDREQDGEHRGREAHRLERNSGIEIDIRIKFFLDEV